MEITKPKENQVLIEADFLKNFDLAVKSKTGLNDSEFNDAYEVLMLAYRQPGMDASKQIFMGSQLSIITVLASTIQNLLANHIIDEEILNDIISNVKQFAKETGEK